MRLKRLTLLVDPHRHVRAVQFPVQDPAGSVDEALELLGELTAPSRRRSRADRHPGARRCAGGLAAARNALGRRAPCSQP
jgi:hypothetical protein